MKAFRNVLTKVLNGLTGISFLIMVVLTCWQVITRYILDDPSTWSEELVGYLFAWMSLFGSCIVTGERGHMNIPILVERTAPLLQKTLLILGELAAFLFAAIILLYGGVRIADLAMGQMTSALGVPIGLFYVVLPLSGALNIIYTVMNLADIVSHAKDKEEA